MRAVQVENSLKHLTRTSLPQNLDAETFVDSTCRHGDMGAFNAAIANFGLDAIFGAISDAGYSCLTMAARYGRRNVIHRLIDLGVDVNGADGRNSLPLHWSAKKGFRPITEDLLNVGADPNLKDGGGNTPMHHAAW